MKNIITLINKLAIISCAALFYAALPQQAQAQAGDCAATYTNPPVANSSDCSCTLGACSPSVVIVGHASYNSCATTNASGYSSCLTPNPNTPQYDYYDSTPCQSSVSFTGYAECALALIATGGVDLGVCFTTGEFTGGASCYAAITTSVALYGTDILVCRACNLAPCSDPSSATTPNNVTPNGADSNSSSCPLLAYN